MRQAEKTCEETPNLMAQACAPSPLLLTEGVHCYGGDALPASLRRIWP